MLGFFMVKLMVVWLVVNQLNCCIYREWNNTMDIVFLFCALGVWWNVLKNISLIFLFVCCCVDMADDIGWHDLDSTGWLIIAL